MAFEYIDLNNWSRREHFEHYLTAVPCSYSMSVKLDITTLKNSGKKLYPAMLFCLTQIINQHEEFRMSLDKDGKPGYFDRLIPCYTIFHKDSETFSTLWTECGEDYDKFLKNYETDLSLYKDNKSFEAKPDTPQNVFNVSMLPWASFDGFNLNCPQGMNYLLPIFTIGKYFENSGRILLPFAIQAHHSACDGFHVCRLINELCELLHSIS